MAGDIEDLKREFAGIDIDYIDHRIKLYYNWIYYSSTFFFLLTDENPFCSNAGCKLFYVHWQDDLIRAQVNSQRICKRDLLLLDKFLKGV